MFQSRITSKKQSFGNQIICIIFQLLLNIFSRNYIINNKIDKSIIKNLIIRNITTSSKVYKIILLYFLYFLSYKKGKILSVEYAFK